MPSYEAKNRARVDVAWSPDEELAWYHEHVDRLGQEYSMIYPFLEASRKMSAFLENSEVVESRSSRCGSWMVYQEVNMDVEEGSLILLCKDTMGWSVVNGEQVRRIYDPVQVVNMDAILDDLGGDEIIGMPCLPIFGASVEYLTIYHLGEMRFKSVYAREADRAGCGESGCVRGVKRRIDDLLEVFEGG